jgi:hypothetical protein
MFENKMQHFSYGGSKDDTQAQGILVLNLIFKKKSK